MSDGVEMLGSDCWQNYESYTFIYFLGISDVVGSTINGHIVAPSDEASCEFFCKRLEAAVVRWNAACAKDGQFHGAAIIDYAPYDKCKSY